MYEGRGRLLGKRRRNQGVPLFSPGRPKPFLCFSPVVAVVVKFASSVPMWSFTGVKRAGDSRGLLRRLGSVENRMSSLLQKMPPLTLPLIPGPPTPLD